jgi:hypothetical protein
MGENIVRSCMEILEYKRSLTIRNKQEYKWFYGIRNKHIFLIVFILSILIGFLLVVLIFDYYFYEALLSEDYSILNAGENSSQTSSQQNFNNGGSSSNNPNPNPNPNPGPAVSYTDTVLIRDTDRLASYLESYRNQFY